MCLDSSNFDKLKSFQNLIPPSSKSSKVKLVKQYNTNWIEHVNNRQLHDNDVIKYSDEINSNKHLNHGDDNNKNDLYAICNVPNAVNCDWYPIVRFLYVIGDKEKWECPNCAP